MNPESKKMEKSGNQHKPPEIKSTPFVIIKVTPYGHEVVARGENYQDGERTFEKMDEMLLEKGEPNSFQLLTTEEYNQKYEQA